jgi:hypothetical protein
MGEWQGVTMNSLKLDPRPPCPNLLHLASGPPLKQFYGYFRGGLPAGQAAHGHRLHLWTPHAVPLWLSGNELTSRRSVWVSLWTCSLTRRSPIRPCSLRPHSTSWMTPMTDSRRTEGYLRGISDGGQNKGDAMIRQMLNR